MNSLKITLAIWIDKICGFFSSPKPVVLAVPTPKTKAKKTTKKSEKKTK